MLIEEKELKCIVGGNATLINAIARGINTVLDLGRSLGTAIRRVVSGSVCPL